MSEKPQEAREDDLLEQIITQGLEKVSAPAQTPDAVKVSEGETSQTPKEESGEDVPPPADRKNRRSSVYLYLLILFGAAFLMLLLAYFVQRRSNEDTISDLRDSMNLSRQELLDEIKELEDKNAELEGQNIWLEDGYNRLIGELYHWRTQYEEQVQDANDLLQQYSDAQEMLYSWTSFWGLEQYYQAGDYANCARVLIVQRQGTLTYRTPVTARERQAEIVRAVIDAGYLDEDYAQYPDYYNDLMGLDG